jgi:hypothetical protein
MIAFEVSLNGKKICVAGVGDLGVLTTMLSWVRREGRNTETGEPGKIEEELTLSVGGLMSSTNEHVQWTESALTVGDEVYIRVTELESVDAPRDRRTEDPVEDAKRQQNYVEEMAKRFGWTIQK